MQSKIDKILRIKGSIVALVTPMNSVGELDEKSYQKLIEMHLEQGTQGFVINGTTGESPTLDEPEREKLITIATKSIQGKVPIIMGTGTNSTHETIRQTKIAASMGADASLVVTPYYNKPTQEGLRLHFQSVAEASPLPMILYNVPQRTAVDLLPETTAKLAKIPNIVGLKDATGEITRCHTVRTLCGENFSLFSGCDDSALAFMLQGGNGVISVTANVIPRLMQTMCEAALAKDIKRAGELNNQLMPLHKALFLEANPIPVKWAVTKMGWIENNIRLPLTRLSETNQKSVYDAMKMTGVINQ